jgi:hypothetical protein
MTMDGPDDRARHAWQAQATGETNMNVGDIRLKAALFEARTTRQLNLTRVAFGIVLIGNVLEILFEPNALERIGSGLTILAVAFVAFHYRRRKQRATAGLASRTLDSLQFYRAELVRQRDEIGHFWWRYALPFVPGIALSLGPGLTTPKAPAQYLAMAVGLAVLLAGIAIANRWEARKLQAKIDELDG